MRTGSESYRYLRENNWLSWSDPARLPRLSFEISQREYIKRWMEGCPPGHEMESYDALLLIDGRLWDCAIWYLFPQGGLVKAVTNGKRQEHKHWPMAEYTDRFQYNEKDPNWMRAGTFARFFALGCQHYESGIVRKNGRPGLLCFDCGQLRFPWS